MTENERSCKIAILQHGPIKEVYINGQNVSGKCTGIKIETPTNDTTTVTLTFDVDELCIKSF